MNTSPVVAEASKTTSWTEGPGLLRKNLESFKVISMGAERGMDGNTASDTLPRMMSILDAAAKEADEVFS